MPSTTPNLLIPYPLSSEAPAGHSQMQSLASRVDVALGQDSGWVPVTPVSGFTNQNTTGYRVIGKTCYLSMQLSKNTSALTNTDVSPILATLPALARPSNLLESMVFSQTGTNAFVVARMSLTSAGVVSVFSLTIALNGFLRFFGSYPVAGL